MIVVAIIYVERSLGIENTKRTMFYVLYLQKQYIITVCVFIRCIESVTQALISAYFELNNRV
jgi:hypothetical protein